MSNEIVKTQKAEVATQAPKTIRDHLESRAFVEQVQKVLPKHLTPERFVRVAVTAMMRTPKLAECDQSSFFNAMLTLSQLGIEPDGRRAHLIPFMNNKRGIMECQLIVDYKGLVELAIRSGQVANIHADVVCANDAFEYDCGEVKRHSIDFKAARGEMYAAYAICTFKDGTKKCEVMSKDEVESIRKRSRAGDSGPWKTDYNEMSKKTVFRRLSKWLPLSPEMRDAIEADDTQFTHSVTVEPEFRKKAAESLIPLLAPAQPEADEIPMGEA